MQSNVINRMKTEPLPILFSYVGWADRYDGTEPIAGNFSYVKEHPKKASEAYAFLRDSDGLYRCGVGRGELSDKRLHVVFVARDTKDNRIRIVGLYPSARIEMEDYWAVATCRRPILIPSNRRPNLKHWPVGQGLRRWAWRGGENGSEHGALLKSFKTLLRKLPLILRKTTRRKGAVPDEEFEGFEGTLKRRYVAHRSRENQLRLAKIREALRENNGKLHCEVPKCGFDFGKRYGRIGIGYAQVHHLRPLSSVPAKGVKSKLSHLAIVCANCHVMIHHGGQCRPLKNLIAQ